MLDINKFKNYLSVNIFSILFFTLIYYYLIFSNHILTKSKLKKYDTTNNIVNAFYISVLIQSTTGLSDIYIKSNIGKFIIIIQLLTSIVNTYFLFV